MLFTIPPPPPPPPPTINSYDSSVTLHPLVETIQRIQYHATRIITGTWKGTSINKLYEELGWEGLTDRRWGRRIIQLSKIHNNLTPPYLHVNLPQNVAYLMVKLIPIFIKTIAIIKKTPLSVLLENLLMVYVIEVYFSIKGWIKSIATS